MNRRLDPEPQHQIFTLRKSIFIWLCGGVIGWAATILVVYSVFQGGGQQVAQNNQPPSAVTGARNQNDLAPDPNALSKIAPAAGPETEKQATPSSAQPAQ